LVVSIALNIISARGVVQGISFTLFPFKFNCAEASPAIRKNAKAIKEKFFILIYFLGVEDTMTDNNLQFSIIDDFIAILHTKQTHPNNLDA
jgi:hypothetical protein